MTDSGTGHGSGSRQVAAGDRDRLAELGQVAGDLVHELKNPIGVITLNAELLLGKPSPALPAADRELQAKRLKRILDSARSLQSIVQSFLSFARPARPDPDAVDLNALLAGLLEEQADLLEQARIHVSFHRDEVLAMLPADIHHLRSIFLNVISNAREALLERPLVNGESTRKLLVITRAGKGSVRVVIANNGPPFEERVAAHLFEPFVSSKEDGTGLGLAIVRRLVELHQGTVTASSDPTQGVSFTLEFPTPLGPAKARTELPMPTVEARVRNDAGSTRQTRLATPRSTSSPPSRTRRRPAQRQQPEPDSRSSDD
jgi:two-component system NtrC family sensor kinase